MNISAVLLAGGESRRMDKDKATLLFRGKPLCQIQLDLLRKLEPAELFISARTGPVWRSPEVKFAQDDPPSGGALSGLGMGLRRYRTKQLLPLAVRVTFSPADCLRFMLI